MLLRSTQASTTTDRNLQDLLRQRYHHWEDAAGADKPGKPDTLAHPSWADCQAHLEEAQTAEGVLVVAARTARWQSLRCPVVMSRRWWEIRKSGFVGGRVGHRDHFGRIVVAVVEQGLVVVVAELVVGRHRSQAAFASDIGASAPAVEDHPSALEDKNDGCQLATRSLPLTALVGCRC